MNTNRKYHKDNINRLIYKLTRTTLLDYYQAYEAIEDRIRVLTSRGYSYAAMMRLMDQQVTNKEFFSLDNISSYI